MLRNETTSQQRPMFTRRQYAAIAEALKAEKEYCEFYVGEPVEMIVRHIALRLEAVFRKDNPNFNGRKFREACGLLT